MSDFSLFSPSLFFAPLCFSFFLPSPASPLILLYSFYFSLSLSPQFPFSLCFPFFISLCCNLFLHLSFSLAPLFVPLSLSLFFPSLSAFSSSYNPQVFLPSFSTLHFLCVSHCFPSLCFPFFFSQLQSPASPSFLPLWLLFVSLSLSFCFPSLFFCQEPDRRR